VRHVEKNDCVDIASKDGDRSDQGGSKRKSMDQAPKNPEAGNGVSYSDSGMVFMARPSEPVQNSETEADDSEEDDEVEVIKANIFKYQGNLTFDQEVSQDILHFEYYDDFNDEVDDVVILDDDLEMEDSAEHEESLKEAENTSVCCEECGQMFATKELEDHKEAKHPPKKKNIKQFAGGNFFMLAE